MSRLYGKRISGENGSINYYISINYSCAYAREVEVDKETFDVLDELQKEIWRQDRKESRHCVHIDAIPECYLPHDIYTEDPCDALIRKTVIADLVSALMQIPEKQRRRFLMKHFHGLKIKDIAKVENCSERSIKYSLSLAKENLNEILGEIYPYRTEE